MNAPLPSVLATIDAATRVTVLYVDDEILACKYFARALDGDYDVITANSVDEALAILAQPACHVGVLVTDYRMPQRAGSELLRHVELHQPHIVRVLVTAHADKDVLLDTINCGDIFRILEKPLELDTVRLTMLEASARARARSARRESMMAIEETLAFLAHELNTPLATISNFARGIGRRVGAIESAGLQSEIGGAADLMHDNARYCLSVLASFAGSVKLANSAPKPGNASIPVSARQLIASLLDAYPLTPWQRGLIVVDVQQDFGIAALPNCVALVLSSILSNALRALAGRHDARLHFTVLVDGAPRIRIRDNGPGIVPAILERLLVDPVTMHADSGGHGWGMIFCQRIMQSFGGNIDVQSVLGQSTTVALNFPLEKRQQ
jgi:two-component system response regulator PhcR